jgi:imidazolonepropionase-like amidohydrolase
MLDRWPRRLAGLVACAALFAVIAHTGAFAADGPPPKGVVYLGATLIDVTDGVRKVNAAVIIRGDRIVDVRSADEFRPEEGEEIVDVHGKFIMPGLVNTHVHVAFTTNRPVAEAYLRRELYSGVTTVLDMGGDARFLGELKREADLDEIQSPNIFFVSLMAGPEWFVDPRTRALARGQVPGEVPWMQAITSHTKLPLAIAEARGNGATAIKIEADLSPSLIKRITAEAHRQHLLVWARAAVFPARPNDVVDAEVDSVIHACLLGYQLSIPPVMSVEKSPSVDAAKALRPNQEMRALLENIKRRGTILSATLYPYETQESHNCSADVSNYIAREAYRAGIAIATGADDVPNWADSYSALDIELSLLVHKAGMTTADVLRSATLIGARVAGEDQRIGTVERGKIADFVVLDKDPLDDIANIRSVLMVVKHGSQYRRSDYKAVIPDKHTGGSSKS